MDEDIKKAQDFMFEIASGHITTIVSSTKSLSMACMIPNFIESLDDSTIEVLNLVGEALMEISTMHDKKKSESGETNSIADLKKALEDDEVPAQVKDIILDFVSRMSEHCETE